MRQCLLQQQLTLPGTASANMALSHQVSRHVTRSDWKTSNIDTGKLLQMSAAELVYLLNCNGLAATDCSIQGTYSEEGER